MIKRKNYRYHKFLQFKFLQSSPIYVDSCEDSYEDEDCSCDAALLMMSCIVGMSEGGRKVQKRK